MFSFRKLNSCMLLFEWDICSLLFIFFLWTFLWNFTSNVKLEQCWAAFYEVKEFKTRGQLVNILTSVSHWWFEKNVVIFSTQSNHGSFKNKIFAKFFTKFESVEFLSQKSVCIQPLKFHPDKILLHTASLCFSLLSLQSQVFGHDSTSNIQISDS